MRKTLLVLIYLILIVSIIGTVSAASMTRTTPSSAVPGSTFQVTYEATATDGWGVSIVDTVSGGCTFPDGSNELKTVMLYTEGDTKTVNIKAPSSGACTFTGDYKFGENSIVKFTGDTVNIKGEPASEISPYIVIAVVGVVVLVLLMRKKR